MESNKKRYEYKFERIENRWYSFDQAESKYRRVIEENVNDGWRLIQIFAPASPGIANGVKYYEMIFEKELE